jgi:Rrf2 family iron-sulfur cluster assembly transcriptional regulator
MISRTSEYALKALLVLARGETSMPLTADRIAEVTGTPRNYMSKTLYALAKGGLVRGTRGPAGGFALAKPAGSISVADVVAIFAEPPRTHRCLLGTGDCNAEQPCAAHYPWSSVRNAAHMALAATTLADLLAGVSGAPTSNDAAIRAPLSGVAGAI